MVLDFWVGRFQVALSHKDWIKNKSGLTYVLSLVFMQATQSKWQNIMAGLSSTGKH
jgi:hypothetical protein